MGDAAVPVDGVAGRATKAGEGRARAWPRLSFVAALVVLGVALLIGSGVASSHPPTAAQRAAVLETQIRCPSCDDLSVAQSSSSSAIAVRHEVSAMVDSGASDAQVEAQLVRQYGESILLSPPASGLSAIVWYVPAVAGVVAVAGVGLLLWRRSRAWRGSGSSP
jgi:cytochrome c-type biogenesis protein CcmH